jgi:hypothetical protein
MAKRHSSALRQWLQGINVSGSRASTSMCVHVAVLPCCHPVPPGMPMVLRSAAKGIIHKLFVPQIVCDSASMKHGEPKCNSAPNSLILDKTTCLKRAFYIPHRTLLFAIGNSHLCTHCAHRMILCLFHLKPSHAKATVMFAVLNCILLLP